MKILHIGKFYPPFNGGMEVFLRDLSEQQAKTHQVTVLVHNHQYKLLKSATKAEKINAVNIIRQSCLRPILFTPLMLGVNHQVSQLIANNVVDVIHISWPNPSALLLLLNKKAKTKPWIIQWQSDMVTKNSSLLLKFAYLFFKPFEKLLLKQSHSVIASTEEYFNYSSALKPFKDKCHFIPLAIKTRDTELDPKHVSWAQRQWRNAQYKIYNIGRLTFYKNHQLLIEAAQLLPQALFVITGSGELQKKLISSIKQKQINNIILTGSLSTERLDALMKTCDAFCLPSNDRAESYGMVLLEALNFNKPILVSNLVGSGMKWIASQTHLGQTFNCNQAQDLVETIKSLNKQSTNSKITKPSFFHIDQCAKNIDQLYRLIIR